jgi:hypothetical protein
MATGSPGTNGVWQYGEDDSEATFSALLNKAASTTDTQIGADRTRLTSLEGTRPGTAGQPFAQAAGIAAGNTTNIGSASGWFWNGVTTVTFPVGRFTQPPIVTVVGDATNIIMFTQMAAAPTTSGFGFVNVRIAAYPTNQNGYWTATQMTSGSGAG